MRTSKIVLLAAYILFMLLFVLSLVLPIRVAAAGAAAASSLIRTTVLLPISFIVMAILGGIEAKQADRNVMGWAVGCFVLPFILPLVLVLLKDGGNAGAASQPSASGASGAAGGADPDRQRKLDELADLKAKGILTDEEYAKAVRKIEGGKA
jgi:hypothetical protein